MEQIYISMLFVLFVLAVFDLMVGVTNDAVNFVNSAIGSKVASFKTIMIVASLGIAMGAFFSSGMMELAKSGIYNPAKFYFEEVMFICVAVMLTDIILMDFFNSLGLPTSTTVSVVFELLGAAVSMAVMKVIQPKSGQTIKNVSDYINNDKAIEVIAGIFLSVGIAFVVGTVVQYISRLIFTFQYEKKMKYFAGIFGGISFSSLSYFLIIKGMKGVSFISKDTLKWVDEHSLLLLFVFFAVFAVLSQMLHLMKFNVLKIIILTGTFALAMAFAGNDMVNFIGIPIAAWESFNIWKVAGGPDEGTFTMEVLANSKEPASQIFLILAGMVMIFTLWFSRKARNVIETGVSLSRQDEGKEKFEANALSRIVVRGAVLASSFFEKILPNRILKAIDTRFQKPDENEMKSDDKPAFDLIRASVNLVIASSLISMGTSMKLPLSTTYVTFMVAMGSSLADRAWGRESAVFRVAGVFNVIAGWFLTAAAAFLMTFVVGSLLFFFNYYALFALISLVGYLLFRSASSYRKKEKEEKSKEKRYFERNDLITIKEIVRITASNSSKVIKKISNSYLNVIEGLAKEDLTELKTSKKKSKNIIEDIDELKGDIFYFIRSLDDTSVTSSKFYILTLDYLHNMAQSTHFMAESSYVHTNNNHKKLKESEIKALKSVSSKMKQQMEIIQELLKVSIYESSTTKIIEDLTEIKDEISLLIEKQIKEIRATEASPKNTKLYFSLLLETKGLIRSLVNFMSLYKDFKDQYKQINN